MQKIQFEYFTGMEAEQYSFYRVPKVLFTAECFKSLSCEAKVLYGLLLDRMSLSIKNRWLDEEDRVYIVFTVEEIADLMNCGTQKAVKLLKELDTDKGIGLIEKRRLGLGKPNVIYVKNFMIKDYPEPKKEEKQSSKAENTKNSENHNSGVVETAIQEFSESQFKNFQNQESICQVGILHFNTALKSQRSVSPSWLQNSTVQGKRQGFRKEWRDRFLDAYTAQCYPPKKSSRSPLGECTTAAGSTTAHLWVVSKCALGRIVIDYPFEIDIM